MTRPSTRPVIAAAVRVLLAKHGPQSEDELLAALPGEGIELGVDPEEILEEVLDDDGLGSVVGLLDGRYADLPSLLAGRMFTHRLSSEEIEHGYLTVSPDLEPLSLLVEDPSYQRLVDGSAVVEVLAGFDDERLAQRGIELDGFPDAALLLDPQVLRDLEVMPGELVGVRVQADGLQVARAKPSVSADEVGAAVLGLLEEQQQAAPEEIDRLVWQLCVQDEALFTSTVVSPLVDVFAGADLVWDGDQVAPAGFDFGRWRIEGRLEHLGRLHRLDDDEALAVLVLSRMFEQVAVVVEAAQHALDAGESLSQLLPDLGTPAPGMGDGGSDDQRVLAGSMLALLEDPAVAQAVLMETLGTGRESAAALGVFAETLEPVAPRPARAAVRWLRGKALERLGDLLAAEQEFESALALDPTWPPVLFDLARIASDRGDAERGLSLLRRADAAPDDQLMTLLSHFRTAERADLGRNQPCWCGSGRKYKVCHRGCEQAPLEDRAAWLYQKAGMYLTDGPWRERVLDVASARAAHWTEPLALWEAVNDPLVADTLLFEGGAFAEFLQERGVLLPDDEGLLAGQWLLTARSVFEVEQVTAGSGFGARDLRTGDRVEVRERAGSRQLSPGTLVCARLVPAGDTVQCFGGIEVVTMADRDALLELLDDEPEPEELITLLSRRFAPPQLQNTEGETLVLCEVTLRCPDPDALVEALSSTYERDGAELRWHEHITTHGMQRIRAVITLDGDEIGVEANSEARLDRVLTVLHGLQADLEILTESRDEAPDVMEAMRRAPNRPTQGEPSPDDPALLAALEEMILSYEQAWLDEPIPALAGATPREAAADPTRRPDLQRLLDSFPQGAPGAMDVDRLRAALEL